MASEADWAKDCVIQISKGCRIRIQKMKRKLSQFLERKIVSYEQTINEMCNLLEKYMESPKTQTVIQQQVDSRLKQLGIPIESKVQELDVNDRK